MYNIALLGSTGSIGTSTLSVVEEHSSEFKVTLLSAHKSKNLLLEQIERFKPEIAFLTGENVNQCDKDKAHRVGCSLYSDKIQLLDYLNIAKDITIVLAITGAAGLEYGLASLTHQKRLAIANKEPIAIAGHLFYDKARENNCQIMPIDSEHSAIFQCLEGKKNESIEKIILTSSGGPFHGHNDFNKITPSQALKHPTWSMGQKITIDSATMINKGLEIIEAKWLFDMPLEKIDVIVHRQSIIHSMVQFIDGSILAQMGVTDMRFPIFFALTYPESINANLPRMSFEELITLTFEKPNPFLNQALNLAKIVAKNDVDPIIFNASNEIFVDAFLKHEIAFQHCYNFITKSLEQLSTRYNSVTCLEEVLNIDSDTRKHCQQLIKSGEFS